MIIFDGKLQNVGKIYESYRKESWGKLLFERVNALSERVIVFDRSEIVSQNVLVESDGFRVEM